MKKYSVKAHRIATFFTFFINGALAATWVSRIPTIQDNLEITEGTLGFVLLGFSIGLLIALFLVGKWINRTGSKKVVVFSNIIGCITLPFLAILPSPISLFTALMLFGASISAMDISMNEQAVLVERKTNKPIMASFHAGYSIGGVAGALFGSIFASKQNANVVIHFLIISAIFSASAFFLNPHLQFSKTSRIKDAKGKMIQLPERPIWILGIIALASAFGEGTAADWSAVFIRSELGTNEATAALGFAAFSFTMTGGRIIGDWLVRVIKPSLVVRLGGFLAGIGFLLAAWTNHSWLAILGFGFVGAGLANIVPQLFSTAGNLPGITPGAGIAGVATIGYAGYLLEPPLIGTISDIFSLRAALSVIALIMISLTIFGKSLESTPKNQYNN